MAIPLLPSQSQLLAQLPQQWHLLLFLAFLLPVFSYLLSARRATEKGLKLPPGPAGVPVLGNLRQLGHLPHQSFRDLARQHGPIMFLRLGMIPAVAVSSAEAARDVLRAHDADCCNRPASPGSKQLTYGFKTVANSPCGGAYWRDMRRLFAAELHGSRRAGTAWAARRQQVEKLLAVLRDAAATSAPVALDKHVCGVAEGIIGTVAYGSLYGAETFEGRYGRFQHVLHEAMEVMVGFAAEDFFPTVAGRLVDRLTGVLARRERVFREVDAFFEAVIEQRLVHKPEEDGLGLVDALVGLWKQGEQGFSKENVKAILVETFLAGADTSSVTILWAMSELARRPEAMRKVQEEIRAAVGVDLNPAVQVQAEELPKLRYLKMVVKETLRLHPPVTLLLPRETAGRVKVGGYDVPAGARVVVNAWAIGRDPASWGPDAEEFVPERFEGSEVDFRGAHLELLPFGAGRRICPGLAMGAANVEFTLANMLCGFDWALPEGVEEVSMEEAGGLTTHRKTPLLLVPTLYRPARRQ